MTLYDYAVVSIIGLSFLLAAWRGVVGELLALGAWVAGFFAATNFAAPAGQVVAVGVEEPALKVLAGFVAVFVGVLILVALVRWFLRSLIKAAGLGVTDRMLGALFGLLRGVLVVLILTALAGMTTLTQQGWWLQATLAPPFETVVLALKPWMPIEMSKRIRFYPRSGA